jgi:hypothetical protein
LLIFISAPVISAATLRVPVDEAGVLHTTVLQLFQFAQQADVRQRVLRQEMRERFPIRGTDNARRNLPREVRRERRRVQGLIHQ